MKDLFDAGAMYSRPLGSMPSVRTHIGMVTQALALAFLDAKEWSGSASAKVVPDMELRPGVFGETKAVGRSGQGIVYKWRLEKELEFAKDKKGYVYCIVSHDCTIKKTDLSGIARHFVESPPVLILATLEEVAAICRAKGEPRKAGRLWQEKWAAAKEKAAQDPARIGYNRAGYTDGYWQWRISAIQTVTEQVRTALWCGSPMDIKIKLTQSCTQLLQS
jgi:hypothetical protein